MDTELKTLFDNNGVLNVTISHVLPSKPSQFPMVDITTSDKSFIKKANNNLFFVTERVRVFVKFVSGASTNYRNALHTLTTSLLQLILTDEDFSQLYEEISDVDVKYEFDLDGDQISSTASIMMDFKYTEQFDINFKHNFNDIYMNLDMLDLFDSNIATSGPDGKIDVNLQINLQ